MLIIDINTNFDLVFTYLMLLLKIKNISYSWLYAPANKGNSTYDRTIHTHKLPQKFRFDFQRTNTFPTERNGFSIQQKISALHVYCDIKQITKEQILVHQNI